MRKLLLLLAVAALALGGCSHQDTPTQVPEDPPEGPSLSGPAMPECPPGLFNFQVDGSQVYVCSYTQDSATQRVSFRLATGIPPSHTPYTLDVQKSYAELDTTVFDATIQDSSGAFLFGIRYQWPTADLHPNWIRITEWTPQDTLTILRYVNGKRITETYKYKGETRAFFYDKSSGDNSLYRPKPDKDVQDERVLDTVFTLGRAMWALNQWEALWSHQNTLNNNANGMFLVSICNNEDFVGWVKQELHAPYLQGPITEVLCDVMASCVLIKCILASPGGWREAIGNPLCIDCVRGLWYCLILRLFGIWA